ncbi:beta-lactamase family protein [Nocardiopsis sp. ARC36]
MREALSDLLQRSARRTGVPGAQLAVYHRGELHTCVTGVEDSATGRPVEDASLFPLGSVTKPVTAALVMQLVEDGDVDLDAPVLDHLGAAPPTTRCGGHRPPPAQPHRRPGLGAARGRPRHLPAPLRLLADPEDRIAPPGTVFSYSNTGYAVAGRLVEAVTGQDWWETVESHLCWSTGMELAPVPAPRPPAPGLVTGHAVDGAGRAHPVGFHIEPALAPAGGLAASAATLTAFGRAFLGPGHAALDGEVAAPEVLGEMGRPVSVADPFGLADGWGAGWSLHLAGDRLWYGHDGTLDGATCNLRVDPEGGTVVALTTNSTTGVTTWEHLVRGLRELGVDVGHYRQPDAAAEGAAATATAPDRVAGRYGNGGLSAEVVHDRGGHRLVMSNGFEGELTTGPGGAFRVVSERHGGIALSGRFLTDPAAPGRATALQYNGRTLRLSGLAVGPNA